MCLKHVRCRATRDAHVCLVALSCKSFLWGESKNLFNHLFKWHLELTFKNCCWFCILNPLARLPLCPCSMQLLCVHILFFNLTWSSYGILYWLGWNNRLKVLSVLKKRQRNGILLTVVLLQLSDALGRLIWLLEWIFSDKVMWNITHCGAEEN